jgi:DNA-binding NtrC family response regulator
MNATILGQNGWQQEKKTALVVDDQEPVRMFVAGVLVRAGFATLVADCAEQAIETAHAHRGLIDVVVSDLQMPGMSGIEGSRELVRHRPALKVLIMTGADLASVKVDSGWLLIGKPFTSDRLLAAVSTILNDEIVAAHHA